MKQQLLKAYKQQQTIEIMYIAKDGTITKRAIKVLKLYDDCFQAYCFTRHAKRTFLIANVLAIQPPRQYERIVI